MMTKVDLAPANYSRAQTVAALKRMLLAAPKQKDTSPEAFKGEVAEFIMLPYVSSRVGTLSEYHEALKADRAIIRCKDGNVIVNRQPSGDWIAE